MADTKISALTAVVTAAGTDEFAVNQSGTSKKMTLSQITDGTLTPSLMTLPASPTPTVSGRVIFGDPFLQIGNGSTTLYYSPTADTGIAAIAFGSPGAYGSGNYVIRNDHEHPGPWAWPVTLPGSVTIATAEYARQWSRLGLSSTLRLTASGTGRLLLEDWGSGTVLMGSPKTHAVSFTVPNDYYHDMLTRLTLVNQTRATLVGTADLFISDDFKSRARIVLAGSGG